MSYNLTCLYFKMLDSKYYNPLKYLAKQYYKIRMAFLEEMRIHYLHFDISARYTVHNVTFIFFNN